MKTYELIAPCHFGMEAVLKKEILDLGFEIAQVEDGRVVFRGDESAVARANLFLRTAERILIKVASFKAVTFDELFERTKEVPWEDFIPADGRFWVAKAASVKSALYSPSDIQSIIKKAMVEHLKGIYHITWFEETGPDYPLRVFLMKDTVTIGLDTTGDSLHKRGYRKLNSIAPIAENLAAGLIMLTPWNRDRILVDPFCGCGTIPIEAAMIAAKMAPGMNRSFTAEAWTNFLERKIWYDAVDEAHDIMDLSVKPDIQAFDIDADIVKAARENAEMAGVAEMIHFQRRPVSELNHPKPYGFLITNPPYGERMEEKEALPDIYGQLGESFKRLKDWSAYIITNYELTEKYMGKKAAKNRKIYNGMMKTYYYQFPGPKPPARRQR